MTFGPTTLWSQTTWKRVVCLGEYASQNQNKIGKKGNLEMLEQQPHQVIILVHVLFQTSSSVEDNVDAS